MMIFPARKIPRSEPHKISKKRGSVKAGRNEKATFSRGPSHSLAPASLFCPAYKHIHLLADVKRHRRLVQLEDYLQHAGINAFGAVAGERARRNDVRLDTHKAERQRMARA